MAKTLAMRHQMYMCYHLSNPVGYLRFPNSHCSGKPLYGNHFDKFKLLHVHFSSPIAESVLVNNLDYETELVAVAQELDNE